MSQISNETALARRQLSEIQSESQPSSGSLHRSCSVHQSRPCKNVRQSISTVLKTLLPAETFAQKRTKKEMTLPQRSRRDAISVVRNVIAKPNRFSADVTIIFVKNTHDSLAFKECSQLSILQKIFILMNANNS